MVRWAIGARQSFCDDVTLARNAAKEGFKVGFLDGAKVLVNLFVSIMMSYHTLFLMITILHIVFYISAFIGWLYEKKGKKLRFLKIPYYFCLVNLAATLGIFDFFLGKQAISWKPVRTGSTKSK